MYSISFTCLQFILAMVGYNYAPVTYNDTDHPEWADIVGWAMVVIAVVWIPIEALIAVCRYGFRGVGCFLFYSTRYIRIYVNHIHV